ncbi:hypothetical protein CHUAL_004832 [Chamberlinius hualienensis]
MLTIGSPSGLLLLQFLCPTTLIIISQAVVAFKYLRKVFAVTDSCINQLMINAHESYYIDHHSSTCENLSFSQIACSQKCEVMSHNDEFGLDLERIKNCIHKLELSGWYYGKLSWKDATKLLKKMAVGTFLMRDSSDPAYLFALSVQTERGPTSVRIHYKNGQFKLDAEDMIAGHMPWFDCAVKLVDYYVRLSGTDKARCHVWLDESGRRDRFIHLSRPLIHSMPTLKHLCRLTFHANSSLQRIATNVDVTLPKSIRTYLNEYPYLR